MSAQQKPSYPHDRPPRFVLKADETQSLAFSRGNSSSFTPAQQVIDVAAGGVAFLVPTDQCPVVGETIGMEIKILNVAHTMSRRGKVLRIEAHDNTQSRIAVQFVDEALAPATAQPKAVEAEEGGIPYFYFYIIAALAFAVALLFFVV